MGSVPGGSKTTNNQDFWKAVARYKFVRSDFVQTILDSGSHHSERPIVANGLRAGVDIFASSIKKGW